MFEPRGHDVMSGSMLYPSTRADCDTAILFIEVSGCLPMCGHGTIGTVTMAIENGLVTPKNAGRGQSRRAGRARWWRATNRSKGRFVESVRITNVASYLAATDVTIDVPGIGELAFDIAYGGNYYAILEPQKNFGGLESMSAGDVLRLSPIVRRLLNDKIQPVHPENERTSAASATSCGPTSRATNGLMPGTRCSTATRRSIAHPAAPAPRRAWPSSPPRAG